MDSPAHFRNYKRWVILLIAGLFLLRLTGMILSPLGLHGDEAQYWAWSKNLDWGYFTKPPLIAWVIWATTSLFGDAEWAVRLSSPVLHSITAYVIYRTARFAFKDDRTGFWAAAIYLLMPALWLSSGIVSTDVPLLLCWAVAMNAWVHLRENPNWSRAVQLGLAVGVGMLAKYAMLFFLPALGLAVLFDPPTRKNVLAPRGFMAGAISFLILVPNIMWNVNHDFATLSHTAANANLQSGIPFHPLELFTFWIDQLAVFGPVTLGLYVLALIAALKGKLDIPAGWIAAFGLSPLVIISIEALLSRANANWAVTTYIAGSILTAHYCVKMWPKVRHWLTGGIAVQSIICLVAVAGMLVPTFGNALGLANSVKRLRAWPETVKVLEDVIAEGHDGKSYQIIAADKRIIYYDLKYYGLEDTLPLKMWMYKADPENHAELSAPLGPTSGPVLVINYYSDYVDEMQSDFDRLVPLPPLDIDLGGGKRRQLKLWAGYNYTPTTSRDN